MLLHFPVETLLIFYVHVSLIWGCMHLHIFFTKLLQLCCMIFCHLTYILAILLSVQSLFLFRSVKYFIFWKYYTPIQLSFLPLIEIWSLPAFQYLFLVFHSSNFSVIAFTTINFCAYISIYLKGGFL